MTAGRLLYLIGASAARKQELLQHLRARLTDSDPVVIAHRYASGGVPAVHADTVVLPVTEFELRRSRGLFVMQWEKRNMRYAIGTEINYWLAVGLAVVVNGSRGHLHQAFRDYPEMTIVWASEATPLSVAGRGAPLPEKGDGSAHSVAGRVLIRLDVGASVAAAAEELLSAISGAAVRAPGG